MKGGNFKRNKVIWAVILIVNFFASWIIREATSDLLLSLSYVHLFATPWIAACQASFLHYLPEFAQTLDRLYCQSSALPVRDGVGSTYKHTEGRSSKRE